MKNLNVMVVALVTSLWSCVYYADGLPPQDFFRPFVYRQLVPILSGILDFVHIPFSVVIVMTISGVGFYLALRKLALEFYALNDWQELYLVVAVLVSLMVLGDFRKSYDLMTAWLFTLALYYIWTEERWKYLAVFTLACFNRETAFLLMPISMMSDIHSMKYKSDKVEIWTVLIAQTPIYVGITLALRGIFADYPGSIMRIDPINNILMLADQPYRLLLHQYGGFALLYGIFQHWKYRSSFLQYSFCLLAPTLLIMYLVFGVAFEIRVFWEVVPVAILLLMPRNSNASLRHSYSS